MKNNQTKLLKKIFPAKDAVESSLNVADKKIREEINKICSFPDENPQPVLSVSKTGVILYANPASEPILTAWKSGIGKSLPDSLKNLAQDVFQSASPEQAESVISEKTYYVGLSPIKGRAYVNIYFIDITARRKAEEGLKLREAKFHSIFENSIEGILIMDLKTKKFIMANSAICRFLGFSEQELLLLGIEDIHTKQQVPIQIKQMMSLVKGKIKIAEAVPCKKKDGSIVYADITSSLIKLDGQVQVAGFFRDVTRRIKTEEALKESRRILKTEQAIAGMGTYVLDITNGKWESSDILDDIFGIDNNYHRTVEGWANIVHPLDRQMMVDYFTKEVLGNHLRFDKEYRILRPSDGQTKWVHGFGDLDFSEGGSPAKMLGAIIDITNKKMAEEALSASELRYRRLFETAQDGILILDYKDGRIIDVNPFLINLLGFPEDTFVGKKLWELGFFKDIAKNKANSARLKQLEYLRYENLPLETADGRKIDVEFVSNAYDVGNQKVIQCNVRNITDRKKAEYLATVSELRYRRLFETAQDGILLVDFETGMIIDANQFLIDLLGYSKADFLEKHLWEVGVFKDIAASKENFATLQKKRYVRFEDLPLETKAGQKIAVEFVANAYHVDGTTVIQCNIRDITARKKAEDAVRKNEKKLKEVQEMAHLGYWEWYIKTGDVKWSDEVFKIFRLNPKTFTPKIDSVMALSPWPEDNKRDKYLINRAINSHAPGSYEQKFLRPDKSVGYYSSTFQGNYDKKGKLISIFGTVMDITESKNAERIIKSSEERYHGIFDSSRDAIITLEPPTWNLTSANPAAVSMFAYNKQAEFIGKNPDKYSSEFQPDGKSSHTEIRIMIEKAMKEGSALFEWTYRRLTGEEFPASVLLNRVKVGDKTFLQATIRDVTRQKTIEQAKMELISMASHQLRTPPTGVKWYASMLLSEDIGKINKKQRSYLTEIMHNNQRMIDLVHSLLSASRIELGKFTPKLKRTKISKIIDDVLDELNPRIIEKKLRLTVHYQKELPYITIDQEHLRIIIVNLISNAIQYTSKNDEIKITVKKKDCWISINISDTGFGIPNNQQSQIFSKFFRADNAINKYKNGTGLGLYIVKTLLNSMGGSINFKSKLNEGTTFFVSVPITCKIKNIF
jgi:PAS domain S-box-containing protein